MLSLKSGVRILGVRPEVVIAMCVAESAYAAAGVECVITSVMDGSHSRASLHYAGAAFDLRTNHITRTMAQEVTASLRKQLSSDFDVVLEENHIHVEFQPKEAY